MDLKIFLFFLLAIYSDSITGQHLQYDVYPSNGSQSNPEFSYLGKYVSIFEEWSAVKSSDLDVWIYKFDKSSCKWLEYEKIQQENRGPLRIYQDLLVVTNEIFGSSIELHIYEKDDSDRWCLLKSIETNLSGSVASFDVNESALVIANLNGSVNFYQRNYGGEDNWGLVQSYFTANQFYGYAIAFRDDDCFVSSPGNDDLGSNVGKVSIYSKNEGGQNNWGLLETFYPSHPSADLDFGFDMDVSDETLVVSSDDSIHIFSLSGGYSNLVQDAVFANEATDIAISDSTIVVGYEGTEKNNKRQGSITIYSKENEWRKDTTFYPDFTESNSASGVRFGTDVSLSDNRVIVGVDDYRYNNGQFSGAAFIYEKGIQDWTFKEKLIEDVAYGDHFGFDLESNNGWLAVSKNQDGTKGHECGAVELYKMGDNHEWILHKEIYPFDGADRDFFGQSVALYQGFLVVGSYWDDDSGNYSGSIYIFQKEEGGADNWGLVKKIVPSDGFEEGRFGKEVSIFGDIIAVGSSTNESYPQKGAVYIYERDRGGTDNWGLVKKIYPSDADDSRQFGDEIDIYNDILVVGVPQHDSNTGNSYSSFEAGVAYIYGRNEGGANNWGEIKILEPNDPHRRAYFGFSLDLNGDRLLVGAPESIMRNDAPGQAYVFEKNSGGQNNWGQVQKVLPAYGEIDDGFGTSVKILGDSLIISSPYISTSSIENGLIRIYEYNLQNGLVELDSLEPPFLNDHDNFGYSLTTCNGSIITGMPKDDDKGENSGSFIVIREQQPFITSWKTDNPGTSNISSITIPTNGSGYSYDIDWDNDGVYDTTGVTGSITHDYGTPGTYQVAIKGTFPSIHFGIGGDRQKILSVDQWGDIQWQTMASAFSGCSNLNIIANDAPDLSIVTSLAFTFRGCHSFNEDINHWDVSNIKSLFYTFHSAYSFNQPLNDWDVRSVTSFTGTFRDARSFNQPIHNWDISNTIDLSQMFLRAYSFNQDISNWKFGNVQFASDMFNGASSFNQDIGDWNTSSLRFPRSMFRGATSFNYDLSNWDVSSVEDMEFMFYYASSFNHNLNNWDVSSVRDMKFMFYRANDFDQDLSNWDISSVTNMSNMLDYSGLSIENYDSTLIGWSSQNVKSSVTLGARNKYYCTSSTERDDLINNSSWSIIGDQFGCPPTAYCKDAVVDLQSCGYGSILVSDLDNGSIDDIEIQNILLSQQKFDTSHIGVNSIVLTVIDNVGLRDTCSALVTVNHFTPLQSLACTYDRDSIFSLGEIVPFTNYGSAVSQSLDRIVVGAYREKYNEVEYAGAVYVYAMVNDEWQEQKIGPSDPSSYSEYGRDVDIGHNRIVVGAPSDDQNAKDAGCLYIYELVNSNWEETKLLPNDGEAYDNFGNSVAMDSNRIVVGARSDDDKGFNSGSVYVYEKINGNWEETKLVASDGENYDEFGHSVAIDHNRIVVGARSDDDKGFNSGSVYVYEKINGNWEETKLVASDGGNYDQFGSSLAVDGNQIIVGSPFTDSVNTNQGSIYFYEKIGNDWEETQILGSGGNSYDYFGSDVEIQGDRVIAMASGHSSPYHIGRAYIFHRNNGIWSEAFVNESHGLQHDVFNSTSLRNDRLVVGAQNYNGNGSGTIRIFDLMSSDTSETILSPEGRTASSKFAEKVSVHGNDIVSGAIDYVKNGERHGAIYTYSKRTGNWKDQLISPADLKQDDDFGYSHALTDDRLLISAPGQDSSRGSVYIYNWSEEQWTFDSKVIASGGQQNNRLGTNLATNGNRFVASTLGENKVYIYELNGNIWTEEIIASTNQSNNDFGKSIDISDDRLVVGSNDTIYVYESSNGTWSLTKLTTSDRVNSESFGSTVAIYNDVVVVGDALYDGYDTNTGRIHIFEFNGQTWEETIIEACDWESYMSFGSSIDIWENKIVVGNGAAYKAQKIYLLEKIDGIWEQESKSVHEDDNLNDISYKVSISQNAIGIAASSHNNPRVLYYDVTCDGCPDLSISSLQVDTLFHSTNTRVEYTMELKNNGDGNANLLDYTLSHFYIPNPDSIHMTEAISSYSGSFFNQDTLKAGDSLDFSFFAEYYAFGQDTTPYLYITVMEDNDALDCDEANNSISALAVCHQCDPCSYDYEMLSMDLTPGMTDTIRANQWLQFNGMVMPSMNEGDVLMITAGKYLELLPGYEAQLGAEVEYEIEPCNSAALEED